MYICVRILKKTFEIPFSSSLNILNILPFMNYSNRQNKYKSVDAQSGEFGGC